MYETEADLARLQELIDASFARSSEHLLSIMTPPRRLTARRLAQAEGRARWYTSYRLRVCRIEGERWHERDA